MKHTRLFPEFQIVRDEDKCIQCEVCVRQCGFEVHEFDADDKKVKSDNFKCVGCQRCATICPTKAITVSRYPQDFKDNYNWKNNVIKDIFKQSETGGILLTGMGCVR